ncbi:MAG: N-acetyltransferase, partial [Methylocystis sp.]|nr:N-acetyltransferase [Methylocystis sp.]
MAQEFLAQEFSVRYAESLDSVAAEAWDACANPPGADSSPDDGERYNPFLSHAFLSALERSKSVGARTGWTPAYALVEDAQGRLVACA